MLTISTAYGYIKGYVLESSILSYVLFIAYAMVALSYYHDSQNNISSISAIVAQNAENVNTMEDYLKSLKYGQDSMYNNFCDKFQSVTEKVYGEKKSCLVPLKSQVSSTIPLK